MPHFVIEYSANLDTVVDIPGLARTVHDAVLATGVFPLKGTRTRAERRDVYVIADAHPDNAFVHVTGRIGSGRELSVRSEAAHRIFDAVCEFLADYGAHHPLAISFEFEEIEPATSLKQNNLPEWLKQRESS